MPADRTAEDPPASAAPSALALLSGGLDSAVAAALHQRGGSGSDGVPGGVVALGLFVDYGQRAAGPELRAVRAVGDALGFEVVSTLLPLLGEITTTALVRREAPLPHPSIAELEAGAAQTADAVWVPNRNAVLVNLAAALAEARGLAHVVVGFNAEEAASFPDNGPVFLQRLNACLSESTRGTVAVVCPTLTMTKAQIWAAGERVGLPLHLTWSCYEGGSQPCGECESCRRRERAAAVAGGAGGADPGR